MATVTSVAAAPKLPLARALLVLCLAGQALAISCPGDQACTASSLPPSLVPPFILAPAVTTTSTPARRLLAALAASTPVPTKAATPSTVTSTPTTKAVAATPVPTKTAVPAVTTTPTPAKTSAPTPVPTKTATPATATPSTASRSVAATPVPTTTAAPAMVTPAAAATTAVPKGVASPPPVTTVPASRYAAPMPVQNGYGAQRPMNPPVTNRYTAPVPVQTRPYWNAAPRPVPVTNQAPRQGALVVPVIRPPTQQVASRAQATGSSSYSPKTSGATRWFRTNARQPKGIAVFVVIAIIGIIVLIAMCTAAACACMCIVKRATSRGKREVDPEVADSNANDNYIKQGNTHVAAANSCSLNIEQPPPQKAQASYPYLQANGRPPFPHAASEPERPLV